jgi:hypothetical protein
MKKISGYIKKFSGYIIFSPEMKSFQKCPLGKKCNLNDIFHARKGHFATGKRALGKTWGGGGGGGGGGLASSCSYAPVKLVDISFFIYLTSKGQTLTK